MKLVASKTSPYARKVRIILAEKKLPFEFVAENVWDPATRILDFNPLGKVPALVSDEGETLFDSPVIAEYLDGLGGPRLIPAAGIERARVKRQEALGDGIADAGIGVFLERKRDAARQDGAWMERQLGKMKSGTAALARELGDKQFLGGDSPSLGDIACGCALFWAEFRMPDLGLRAKHPTVDAWAKRLETRPSFSSTRPQDA